MTDDTQPANFWDLNQYKSDTAAQGEIDARPERKLRLRLDASGGVLFWTSLKLVMLTVITLGIYRFWMTTKLRRYFWGAIRIDGDPLEYTGRGIEKLLGFLLALVILAVYLGAVNLILVFMGLSFAAEDPVVLQASLQLSVLSTLPFIFYAIYRGQRYLLARTRWRGIRFGLAPGAWGYMWRALGLTLLTIFTLGLAYPYQQFSLAKYVTDRAYFGDMRFAQHGGWGELFAQWVWIYIIGAIAALIVWGAAANPGDGTAAFLATIVLSFGFIGVLVAIYRYQIAAFKILWNNRTLGDARFENDLSPGRVLGIYVGGSIAVAVCTTVVGGAIAVAVIMGLGTLIDPAIVEQFAGAAGQPSTGAPPDVMAMLPVLIPIVLLYLFVIALGFAFTMIFITLPVLRCQVEGMLLVNPDALLASRQRAHDPSAEAGGFADALGVDLGAGV